MTTKKTYVLNHGFPSGSGNMMKTLTSFLWRMKPLWNVGGLWNGRRSNQRNEEVRSEAKETTRAGQTQKVAQKEEKTGNGARGPNQREERQGGKTRCPGRHAPLGHRGDGGKAPWRGADIGGGYPWPIRWGEGEVPWKRYGWGARPIWWRLWWGDGSGPLPQIVSWAPCHRGGGGKAPWRRGDIGGDYPWPTQWDEGEVPWKRYGWGARPNWWRLWWGDGSGPLPQIVSWAPCHRGGRGKAPWRRGDIGGDYPWPIQWGEGEVPWQRYDCGARPNWWRLWRGDGSGPLTQIASWASWSSRDGVLWPWLRWAINAWGCPEVGKHEFLFYARGGCG